MKKLFLPVLLALALPLSFSCSSSRLAGYSLNQRDAAAAIREMLSIGASNNLAGAFSKDQVLNTLFPQPVGKILNTLNTLGLTNEIDRFTTTLSTAAEQTATASAPIFINSINQLQFGDAIQIIKNGGTSATDYLRTSAGDSVRRSITPIMQNALEQYKLNEQWNRIIKPLQAIGGGKLNINLAAIMSGLVSDAMFREIAEKEVQVRSDAAARTTNLLQNVFSKSWN